MRNLKKFLALVLATMMLLSVAVISTNAAETNSDYVEAAQRLASLQVMKGNENGDLMLENGVTRYQAALFFVQALTGETDVAVWNADKKSASFSDVPEYGTAIDYANGIGIVKGLGNGTFGYNNAITYQDMLVMAVRALGYETADMSYPYGYILAAQKLGLTDKVDLVNYKAALTRGETARIIWDMLNTQVAVVDPLTDKVYYPEANKVDTNNDGIADTYLTENSLGKMMEREALIVDSGLAGDVITVTVDKFVEGDEDDETVDTLEVSGFTGLTAVKAADLGITVDTPVISYAGLEVELYVSVEAKDFTDAAYEDGDAKIVFATFPEYTTVQNLDANGDIKFINEAEVEGVATKDYLSIAGNKYKAADYEFVTKQFVSGKWTVKGDVTTIFEYNAKADVVYVNGGNTYGEVSYRVIESGDKNVKGTVEILYTAYEFGQYNVREIAGTNYTVIGTYNATPVVNKDDVSSNFVEKLVGYDKVVKIDTKSVTIKQGEKAASVVVEGEAVEAGDFMFYNYNSVDNILTVVKNCGKFQTGRLTAQSPNAKTVKINGTNYEFGFAGNADVEFNTEYRDVQSDYIAKLASGKDNVKFLAVDGKVVYMETYEVKADESVFPFAIINLGDELATLLDLDNETKVNGTTEFEDALTKGLYVEDGVVKVAMLNLTTGEWELASVGTFAQNWDAANKKFKTNNDLASGANYYDIANNATKYGYVDTFAGLNGIVAVVDVADGVYTIAKNEANFFNTTTGTSLNFYDNSNLTNSISVDSKDATVKARLEHDAETVVVTIVNGVVGARVGVQPKDATLGFAGTFYSTTSDLIVYVANEGVTFDVANWEGVSADTNENYYITTANTVVEVEVGETEDDPYTITITNLYDMKAMAMVEAIEVEAEDISTTANAALIAVKDANVLLYKDKKDAVTVSTKTVADVLAYLTSTKDAQFEDVVITSFEDANTIAMTGATIDINDGRVVTVDATVVTLNQIVVTDKNEYDLGAVVSTKDFVAEDIYTEDIIEIDGVEYSKCAYELDLELVNKITAPEAGVLDDNVLALAADTILAPNVEADDYTGALEVVVTINAVANYDEETGVVTLVVYKVLTAK